MPSLEDILAEVDTWFAEEIQRAPLSYNTEIYNQAYAARASLRNRLAVLVTGKPLDLPPPATSEPDAADEEPEQPEKPAGASTGSKSSKSA